MAGFSDAPAEVIDHILSFIKPRADLANLCLVNKSLRQSAKPLLYSNIEIRWDLKHKNPPIIPLLRTLLQAPELLTLIDVVYLSGTYFHDTTKRPSLDTTTVPLDQLVDAINKTQVSFASRWVERLRSGSMDALAGVLIANLTKISRLDISHNFINGDDILGQVLRAKVFDELPGFKRLQKISYIKTMDREVWQRNEIFPFASSLFYLPTVTDISISMSNPDIFEWPRETPNLDHLTSLHIEWAVDASVVEILLLTPNLKSLSWRWIYHDSDDEELELKILNFDDIVETLSFVEDTLEKFSFSMEIGDDGEDRLPVNMPLQGSFNGLTGFEQLKELSIPLVCLAGFEAEPIPLGRSIPANLEVLHLQWASLNDFGIKLQWLDKFEDLGDATGQMMQSLVDTRPSLRYLTASAPQMYLEVRPK